MGARETGGLTDIWDDGCLRIERDYRWLLGVGATQAKARTERGATDGNKCCKRDCD
jgi:hypothetical protein